jgi:hypothetical protein
MILLVFHLIDSYAFMTNLSSSPYLIGLATREAAVKPALDALIVRLQIRVVGDGYIDAITQLDRVEELLNELTRLGIAVTLITLWCDCTLDNKRKFGCPHGLGGPGHTNGFFSEICEKDYFNVANSDVVATTTDSETNRFVTECNQLAREYVVEGMKARSDYSPCFLPGFWLGVPDNWKSN